MLERVYDGSEIVASCWLRDSKGNTHRVAIQKISPSGAILSVQTPLSDDGNLSVELEFATGERCQLAAHVLRSGSSGLFLAWQHVSPADAQRLERLLRPASSAPATAPPETATPRSQPARSTLLQIDGKTDLYATLRHRARSIRSADIAARHNTVRVIDLNVIAELVASAVEQAVGNMQHAWTAEEKAKLRREAEDLVKSELAGLSAEKSTLARQLTEAQAQLALERENIVAPERFTVSERGLLQLDERMGRLLDRCIAKGTIEPELEGNLRELLARLLDSERARIAEQARNAQSDRVQLLERKIERLSRSLKTTRKERDHARAIAQELELNGGGGLRNIYSPGLKDDDPARADKLLLMRELFESNKELHIYVRDRQPAIENAVSAPARAALSSAETRE